jgi:RimJ/RimL family protein N-acetyltransferase
MDASLAPVVLEGMHVRLEPLEERHAAGLCEIGLVPELWELALVRVQTPQDMAAYIQAAQGPGQLAFAVVHKESGRLAGSTRYLNYEPYHKRVEIGSTWYGIPYQRTAVNTECKLLLMEYAFETLRLHRVEFKADSRNTRSRTAILRIGAQEEGTLRKHMIAPGHVRDTVYFSVIAQEWPEVKKRLELLRTRRCP